MRIAIFTVCRSARVENGLLTINDAYGGISVPKVPFRSDFTIATRLYFTAAEKGEFSGFIRMIDPDGRQLAESPIRLNVPIPEQDVTGVYADSIGGFSITFRNLGEFQFHFIQPEKEPFVFPFYVNRLNT